MHRDDTSLALVSDDTVVLRGDILLFLFHAHTAAAAVALALVFQAAHEPSADPRDLRRVEGEVLLLRHADGDGHEVIEEGGTA